MLVSRQSSTLSTTSKDTSTSSTAGTATMFILAALNKILADKYVGIMYSAAKVTYASSSFIVKP